MQEKMKVSDTCDLEQTVLFRWISAKIAIVVPYSENPRKRPSVPPQELKNPHELRIGISSCSTISFHF